MLEGPVYSLESRIQGRSLDGLSLFVADFKRGRTERESYFNIFIERDGERSLKPVVQGLFFVGRGEYIKPWVEYRLDPRVEFAGGEEMDLEEEGLSSGLITILAELIPAGGSMMMIYGAEPHPLNRDTELGLKRGFPPSVTPLGYYLWNSGFRWYKDWYFPEGWMEGGMKLQATRPLDEDVKDKREEKAGAELGEFVSGLRGRELTSLEEEALSRAGDILSSLAPTPEGV